MRRRALIALVSAATVAWPGGASVAQGLNPVLRIGVLIDSAEADPQARSNVTALQRGLRRLGWIEGRNLRIEYRWVTNDPVLLWKFAKELVKLEPDLIIAHSTPGVATLLGQTRSIPIVFVSISDPIGEGFVVSFARPGGNVTGFTNFEAAMTGKWVQMLKMIAPDVSRVTFLFNPQATAGAGSYFMDPIDIAVSTESVKSALALVHDEESVDAAFVSLSGKPGEGVVVLPDVFTVTQHHLIIAKAARYRVPTVYNYRFMAERGGLMSYGVDLDNLFERAATYVDRILRGAKPAELPVEAPTRFELIINLSTAKALGLLVPDRLMVAADEVIE